MKAEAFNRANEIVEELSLLRDAQARIQQSNQMAFGSSGKYEKEKIHIGVQLGHATVTFTPEEDNMLLNTVKLIVLSNLTQKIKDLETEFEAL